MIDEIKIAGMGSVFVLTGEDGGLPTTLDSRSLLSESEHSTLTSIMKWRVDGRTAKWILINTLDVSLAEAQFKELKIMDEKDTVFRVVIMGRFVAYGGWSE